MADTRISPLRITVLVDHYPALSETFVLAEIASLAEIGHNVHVESAAWAETRAERVPDVPVSCIDDDPLAKRFADLAWLMVRHPLGCLRDVLARRRWAREEVVRPLRVIAPVARRVSDRETDHVHVHFAAGSALDALRIHRLLGIPYSVMAHAYDIYRSPRNLAEKLTAAAFGAGECEYSVSSLRAAVGERSAARMHVIKMGVDYRYFKRREPYPGGRTVIAVGRLIPKKGFRFLLDAAALLAAEDKLERLVIVGNGPLWDELHTHADSLGLGALLEWRGSQGAAGVREALEHADVVVIPAIPAEDGDRDVLPLIAGEALAMEVPVVASEYVGLPEVIRPPWGTLVPPGDAERIAAAVGATLDLPPEERVAAGRAGRRFVIETRDLHREAILLTELIAAGRRRAGAVPTAIG